MLSTYQVQAKTIPSGLDYGLHEKDPTMIGLASKEHSNYQNIIGLKALARTPPPKKKSCEFEIKVQEIEKYEQINGFDVRCGLRKKIDYARATNVAAAAVALPLLILLSVCSLCYMAAMRR